MKEQRPILLIEDDRVDQMGIERIIKELQMTNRLDIVDDGEKALEYLKDGNKIKPSIIILDLNLPRMNGIEFLKIVKQDNMLKKIPIVVLTGSKDDQDTVDSFNLGVDGYMTKPVDRSQFSSFKLLIDAFALEE